MVILQSKIATTHLFLCFICCFLSIALLFNIIESCSILLVGTMCLIQFPDSLLVIFRDECISWLLVLLALRSKLSKKWISSWAQASWAVNWKSSSLQLFSFAHLASVCLLSYNNNKLVISDGLGSTRNLGFGNAMEKWVKGKLNKTFSSFFCEIFGIFDGFFKV